MTSTDPQRYDQPEGTPDTEASDQAAHAKAVTTDEHLPEGIATIAASTGTLDDESYAQAMVESAAFADGDNGSGIALPSWAMSFLAFCDVWLSRLGDRMNPILVKEARQALKSRQFVATFFLLLSFAWAWTLLGVAIFTINSPDQSPPGWAMLIGYFLVLVVPILLVVPYSAFRSLAAEREDGTFELVSITSLSATQVITGKLFSALLQLLVCFSVLAPCMVFTYVLRGVDIAIIGLTLGYSVMCGFLFIVVGLVMGAASKSRHWNTFFSICLFIAFAVGGWGFCAFILSAVITSDGIPIDEIDFWIGNLTVLTIYAGYIMLLLLASAAQISFPSDNRSTRLRVTMVALQVIFVGWGFFYLSRYSDPEILAAVLFGSAAHWMLMGWFMIGESGRISPRARRKLPKTAIARAVFTWFNPGARTGYLLVVANMLMLLALITIGGEIAVRETDTVRQFGRRLGQVQWTTVLVVFYVIFYLGVTSLTLEVLRMFGKIGLFISLMVGVVILTMGAGIPPLAQQWAEQRTNITYSPAQAFNWVWSIGEVVDGDISHTKNPGTLVIMGFSALLVLVVNLGLAVRDVMVVAEAVPRRVLEDDAA